ncbi:MAG: hypothetical protein Q7S34_02210 [bacterium]|nr:hypothetical protein [bacterium]
MNTRNLFFVSVIVFIGLLFIVPNSFISNTLGNTILTVVAFLFGIIAGFYIVVTTTDYNSVKNILASETAGWISLNENVSIYDKQVSDELSILIDKYVRYAFDFEIIDYAKSTIDDVESIKKLVRELPLKESLSSVHQNIRNNIDVITTARQQLTVLGTKTLSSFQWAILWALASLFIFSLYGLRTGELFFDMVTVVISSSAVLILLLIHDLDLYIWNERTFSFDIFQNVFRSIGQLPYYPGESIKEGRVHPLEKEYRVGTYVNFLKSKERKIEIIKTN